jgi:LysM repeat protein
MHEHSFPTTLFRSNSTKKGIPTTQPTLAVPSEYEAEAVPEKSKNSVKKGIVLTVPKISARNVKHIVQQGETLYSLSKKYNISVLDIKTDNQLSENIIGIGQELIIEKKDMMQN